MATSFSTATLNANGLRKDKDRRALFFWLKTLCIDIIFLQETHCHPEDVQNWKKEWGGDDESFWSTCSSNMKGVAVLFNCKLDYKIENMVIDRHARYLYFEFVIEGEKRFKMVNIYAPNDVLLREKFFEGMEKWIDLSDQNLVGGDYNCAQNFDLDRLNCVNEKMMKAVHIFIDSCLNFSWKMYGGVAIPINYVILFLEATKNLVWIIGLSVNL